MWRLNSFVIIVIFQAWLRISSSESRDGDHECLRSCADEAFSRKLCRYEFIVGEFLDAVSTGNESKVEEESSSRDGTVVRRSFLGINGKSPGPRIEVCLGDTIEVILYNRLGSAEVSFHWHGFRQKNSAHMDGVPMVTQCSVLPFGGFRYKLRPESAGSYLYYAHLVSQQADGVYGSLTVRGLQDDPTLERMLLLSSRSPTLLSRYLHSHPSTPTVLLLNGQESGVILKVHRGTRYLLRLINANAYNCPTVLSISGHEFRVLAVDGNRIEPTMGRHIVSFPGERFDIIVKANQPPGKYLIDIRGLEDCQSLRQEAFFLYDDVESQEATIKDEELLKIQDYTKTNGYDCYKIAENFLCALDLKGSKAVDVNTNEIVYIPFDVNAFPFLTDGMSDYRYHIYGCPFYPSSLSRNKKGARVGQINRMSFKYPTSPLFSQPENTPEESICSLEKHSRQCTDTPLFCECVQIIEVPPMKNIDIVLIDEGFGGNDSHTFHIHGYNASILGRSSFAQPITKEEVVYLDRNRQLDRNFVNPPRKDSFVVPNKGYVILRLFTDNLGYWLWEARGTGISPGMSDPVMQFLLKVGDRESFLPVPLDFPTCGNNKHPDMVFETN